jgi:phosphoglycerate dehydrogenase-like enzyme
MTNFHHDVLLPAPTVGRMAQRILGVCPDIRISVIDAAGNVTVDGQAIAPEHVAPTIGWPNLDVFAWDGRRDYFRTLLRSPALRWVQSAAAGVDDPVFGRLAAKGCTLTNSDSQAPAIADFILGAALDFYQQQGRRRELQAAREWQKLPFRELADTAWLIIGYGNIGHETARRAQAFGASITAIRRSPQADALAQRVTTLAELPACLPEADVVVLCSGLNDATRNLANAQFFARMKVGSLLINVGRGGLVDESALLAGLEQDTPRRAVLDVFQTEPLPAEHALWRHPQVHVCAHTSAFGSGNARRGDELFLDNLARYVRGEPLRNRVKPADLPQV